MSGIAQFFAFRCSIKITTFLCLRNLRNKFASMQVFRTGSVGSGSLAEFQGLCRCVHCREVLVMTNRVLQSLTPEARRFLQDHALTRPVSTGEQLYPDEAPFTHAVFPSSGVISLMGRRENGTQAEKAAIGNEGFLGLAVILGGGFALSDSVVRVGGEATYVPISTMQEGVERFACFRTIMMRYAQSLVVQLMETVISSRLDQAEAQVVNWLLLASRRMNHRHFVLTQDSLAEALGLRRVTVGAVWSKLKREEIITYSRGLLMVRDLERLEAYASESYRRTVAAFSWQDSAQNL
jgi:CRP-like cAMP-binding protein